MIILLPRTSKYTPKLFITGAAITPTWNMLQKITGVKRTDRGVVVPLDARLCEAIYWATKTPLDQNAKQWYRQAIDEENSRVQLLLRDDVSLFHPNAIKLWPFQRVSADFIVKTKRSLLASDMGTGKTVTAIVAIEESTQNDKVLVICPNSLKTWWKNEKSSWTAFPDQPATVVETKDRRDTLSTYDGGWLIANYAQLRAEAKSIGQRGKTQQFDIRALRERSLYFSTEWDWLILDEAQTIRNRKTQIAFLTKQLRFQNCCLLTGTPFGNDPSELWSLLNFLWPEQYTSFWRFFEFYVDYEEDYWGTRHIKGILRPKLLRRELAPRMIRKTKAEVMPFLPEKLFQTISLELLPKQEKHYDDMAKRFYIELSETKKLYAVNIISMITRLRQILSTPANFDLPDESAKLDAAMDIVLGTDNIIVIFTAFRKTVEAMCERLTKAEVPHTRIWGGMTSEEISQEEARLNTGEVRVLVATLQSGGVGLNLVGANTAIFVDKWFNPEKQTQAEDRLHRGGQTQKVHVISLYCPNTVDDLVEAILTKKITMQKAVLGPAFLEDLKKRLQI